MAKKRSVKRVQQETQTSGSKQPPAQPPSDDVLRLSNDSVIRIEIDGGEFDGQVFEHDPLVIKIAAEPIEHAHRKSSDKQFVPTFEFYQELALEYVRQGILPTCTPSMAAKLWIRVWQVWSDEKKTT